MFPSGLDAVDDALDGGLPPGGLGALTAPPDAPSERLCYRFAAESDARYVTTFRPADEVAAVLEGRVGDAVDVGVDQVPTARLLERPTDALADVGFDGGLLVVDTATELERAGRDEYRRALDALKRRCRDVGGAVLLHCHDLDPRPMRRGLTLARADVTMRLRRSGGPDRVDHRLAVTKRRGGAVPAETVALSFGERVRARRP